MKCCLGARLWCVVEGEGHRLDAPYNITDPSEVAELREFIQRAVAASNPSDLHLPPKMSAEPSSPNRFVVNISLTRFPKFRRDYVVLRPAIVVTAIGENLWKVDFE